MAVWLGSDRPCGIPELCRPAIHRTSRCEVLAREYQDSPRPKRVRCAARLRPIIIKGIQKKTIQQPAVDLETLFHILSILWAEGARGASIIAAPDWRLFLLSEAQVAGYLAEMARKEWIRFERSGRVVILEMRRTLEIR